MLEYRPVYLEKKNDPIDTGVTVNKYSSKKYFPVIIYLEKSNPQSLFTEK